MEQQLEDAPHSDRYVGDGGHSFAANKRKPANRQTGEPGAGGFGRMGTDLAPVSGRALGGGGGGGGGARPLRAAAPPAHKIMGPVAD